MLAVTAALLLSLLSPQANGSHVSVSGFQLSAFFSPNDLFDRRIAKETISDLPSANSYTVYRYNGDMIWSASAKAMADESEQSTTNQEPGTVSYYLTGDRIDQWLAKQTVGGGSATLNWYQADRLGSITGIADETGVTTVSTTYSAFGQIQDPDYLLQTSTILGFTGREYDSETGLYYYRARYYDPGLGRFISEDPIEFSSGDSNLRRYVRNTPINSADPSGLGEVLLSQATIQKFVSPQRKAQLLSAASFRAAELRFVAISVALAGRVAIATSKTKAECYSLVTAVGTATALIWKKRYALQTFRNIGNLPAQILDTRTYILGHTAIGFGVIEALGSCAKKPD